MMNRNYRPRPPYRNDRSDRTASPRREDSTDWNRVADWYESHLEEDNYHFQVVLPGIEKVLAKLFPEKLKSINLLDLACGNGILWDFLSKKRKLGYTGVDAAADLIKSAHTRYSTDSARFLEGDVTKLDHVLDKGDQGEFDVATCVLALQNIEQLDQTIKHASLYLKSGGYFITVITHPYFRIPQHSDWYADTQKRIISRITWLYQTAKKIEIHSRPFKSAFGAKSEVTYTFHRPFPHYLRALTSAGFTLVDIEEWNSHKKSEPNNPRAGAEDRARIEIPMFMCLVAQKK